MDLRETFELADNEEPHLLLDLESRVCILGIRRYYELDGITKVGFEKWYVNNDFTGCYDLVNEKTYGALPEFPKDHVFYIASKIGIPLNLNGTPDKFLEQKKFGELCLKARILGAVEVKE